MDEEGPKHKCTVAIQQPLFPLCAWNVPGMVIVKQSTHYPRHVLSGNISTWNIIQLRQFGKLHRSSFNSFGQARHYLRITASQIINMIQNAFHPLPHHYDSLKSCDLASFDLQLVVSQQAAYLPTLLIIVGKYVQP